MGVVGQGEWGSGVRGKRNKRTCFSSNRRSTPCSASIIVAVPLYCGKGTRGFCGVNVVRVQCVHGKRGHYY